MLATKAKGIALNKYYPFCFGRADDTSFERLLASIADYFIDNPAPVWSRQVREAQNRQLSEAYAY